jgi:mRNA-degrading endonuclease RelE of RelBE toxin-antitoxin system
VAKKIGWTEQAKSDVRAIDRKTAVDLLHGLARFVTTEEGDVKRLQDIDPPEFRLRLGDYRVRFYDHGDSIEILRVKHRKDAYRD